MKQVQDALKNIGIPVMAGDDLQPEPACAICRVLHHHD